MPTASTTAPHEAAKDLTRIELQAVLTSERAKLTDLLNRVGPKRLDEPDVSGTYTIKDIVAHLAAYQRGLVTWLRAARAGRVYIDPVLDQEDIDARNAQVYEANRARSAADVLRIFHRTFDELEECVERLSDDDLSDAEGSAWFVEPRWHRKQALWQCIANDSYEHHAQHIPDIERWLAAQG